MIFALVHCTLAQVGGEKSLLGSGEDGVRRGVGEAGRVLDKIPGSGSGRSVKIYNRVFPGIFFTLGYFWVYPGMLGIFGYFWVCPYVLRFLSNIY